MVDDVSSQHLREVIADHFLCGTTSARTSLLVLAVLHVFWSHSVDDLGYIGSANPHIRGLGNSEYLAIVELVSTADLHGIGEAPCREFRRAQGFVDCWDMAAP